MSKCFLKDPFDPDADASDNTLSCFLKEAQLDIIIPSLEGILFGGNCEALMFDGRMKNKICAKRDGSDSCQGDSGDKI